MKVVELAEGRYQVTRGWWRKRVAVVVEDHSQESYKVFLNTDEGSTYTHLRYASGDEADGEVIAAICVFIAKDNARRLRERNWKPVAKLPRAVARIAETR